MQIAKRIKMMGCGGSGGVIVPIGIFFFFPLESYCRQEVFPEGIFKKKNSLSKEKTKDNSIIAISQWERNCMRRNRLISSVVFVAVRAPETRVMSFLVVLPSSYRACEWRLWTPLAALRCARTGV